MTAMPMNTKKVTAKDGCRQKWSAARGLVTAVGMVSSLAGAAGQLGAAEFDELAGITLFAFDQVAIPFSQNLRLEMRSPRRHPSNPVVQRGKPGTPDALGVQFYGSVIREGGKFRMWYVAFDDDTANKVASARWRAAYLDNVRFRRNRLRHKRLVEAGQ